MSAVIAAAGSTAIQVGGQLALNYASASISRLFDNRVFEGPRLESFRVLSSTDGAPLPRVFGRVRVGGQVIWATHLRETATEEKVGKGGGPTQKTYSYSISFAVALCEGVISGIERIWANGEVIPTADLTFRVYKGTQNQDVDPLIAAIDGDAPAYRGTAYVVFEDFPLDDYGARLPQLNFEVLRAVERQDDGPRLEDLVTGVNLLPSSGEFAYDTDIVEIARAPGGAVPANMNNSSGLADAVRAVDQLEDQLPNCRSVNIISSWFGTDLRAGHCAIKPGVETDDRLVLGEDWAVGGLSRKDAYRVSQVGGKPVYGGTPSDASLIALIRHLKERGFAVNLYPFILMDVPEDNAMGQAAFPWRGRIAGETAQDIETFFGSASASDFQTDDAIRFEGEAAFGFRRFILHHAAIAKAAGGVDRFVIGSEMVGLTTSAPDADYPAVAALCALAEQARVLLPDAKITYAADWTEYRGHQLGGDIRYHLDRLWAHPDIDLVAIDAYFPLSDWRDGEHLDEADAAGVHDLDYLSANMEGGEGYDWYYASPADRNAQIRSPIDDPVYAYKNVRHWWGSRHFDRTNGVASAQASAWVPESKPIWFSEIGCPAVHLGANQPNVFVDPKSSESFLPYHSSGRRDDLIQRNYLRAFIDHYRDDPMVDGLHVWCWDARPFPEFPARSEVWADGPNWQLGHWLSGRMGRVALADIIADLTRDLDVDVDVSGVSGMVEGFGVERPRSVRAALQGLCEAFAIDVVEAPDRLVFRSRSDAPALQIDASDLGEPPIAITQSDASLLPDDVRVRFVDSARDHQAGLASGARRIGAHNTSEMTVPVVMDVGLAQSLAEAQLKQLRAGNREAEGWLSPDHDLRVGDRVQLPDDPDVYAITRLDGPMAEGVRFETIRRPDKAFVAPLGGELPVVTTPVRWNPAPALFAFDLPGYDGLVVGAMLEPFNAVTLEDGTVLREGLRMGYLKTALLAGPTAVVDKANSFVVAGMLVKLDSAESVLPAANRFAVETSQGWEVLSARDVVLTGSGEYRCSHLLRGLDGSGVTDVAEGARVVWLGFGVSAMDLASDRIGEIITLSGEAAGRVGTLEHRYAATHLRPLSPVHVRASRNADEIEVDFIRRSRTDTGWGGLDVPLGEETERYRVELLSGETVIETLDTVVAHAVFPAKANATHVRVAQGSVDYGWGATATTAIR